MKNRSHLTSRFWLNAGNVSARLDERHLTHGDFADHLGLSRSYWSQLLNRKRPLSPRVRQFLLRATALAGMPEHVLWDRVSDCGAS